MINRFTKPVEHRVQSTQVLPRTEILANAILGRQQKYDETLAQLQQAHGAISGYSVVGDAAKKDLNGLEGILLEQADELMKLDLADPSVAGKVSGVINQLAKDPKLTTHLAAAESYNKYTEQVQDLAKKGKIHESNVYFQNLAWNEYKKTGNFRSDIIGDPAIPEAIDVVSERKKLVDMIKASGSEGIGYLADGHAYKSGQKGVSSQRLLQAVDDQLNTYALSAAGQQEQRDYLMKVHQGSINPEKLDFANYLRQQVWSTAQNFAYSETTTNMDSAINASLKSRAEKKEKEANVFPGMTGSFKSAKYDPNVEFKSDGSIVGSGKSFSQNYAEKGLWGAISGMFTDTTITPEDEYKHAPMIIGSKLNGVSNKAYYDATNVDGNVEYNMFTKNADGENWSNLLLDGGAGNLINMEVVTQDGKRRSGKGGIAHVLGLPEDASAKQVSEAIRQNKDKFKVMGYAKPSEHAAYGLVASINGQNVIVDMSYLLNTNALPPEKKYQIQKEHAFATANAGIPTPTTILDKAGKPVKVVMYKNIHTNKVDFITQEEFKKKYK
jgi:hypothetical protein